MTSIPYPSSRLLVQSSNTSNKLVRQDLQYTALHCNAALTNPFLRKPRTATVIHLSSGRVIDVDNSSGRVIEEDKLSGRVSTSITRPDDK